MAATKNILSIRPSAVAAIQAGRAMLSFRRDELP